MSYQELIVNLFADPEMAVHGLASLTPVEGRMNLETMGGVNGIVDFAHTPEALEKLLTDVRKMCLNTTGNKSRIITVFGCGGDRDRGKRPIMTSMALDLSDMVIITHDSPRNECQERIFR